MKILFGPYGSVFPALGISPDVLKVARRGQQDWYKLAVEMIARGYVNSGATIPTVNAFFLRPVLHAGFSELFKEMLALNIHALLKALAYEEHRKIALCLGPAYDCYSPQAAPDVQGAYEFHKQQYQLCLEVIEKLGLYRDDVVFLHETIGTQREALGLSRAAHALKIPLIISFVVGTDGSLLSKESVETAINAIDQDTPGVVQGFALNCCSPYVFERVVETFKERSTVKRLVGFYPNSYDADPSLYESEATLFEPPKKESLKLIVDTGRAYNLGFIGGCCGYGYYDTKMLSELASKK
jgi:S-methylmethionine-dependent homocysteine/selenocysteine methylase